MSLPSFDELLGLIKSISIYGIFFFFIIISACIIVAFLLIIAQSERIRKTIRNFIQSNMPFFGITALIFVLFLFPDINIVAAAILPLFFSTIYVNMYYVPKQKTRINFIKRGIKKFTSAPISENAYKYFPVNLDEELFTEREINLNSALLNAFSLALITFPLCIYQIWVDNDLINNDYSNLSELLVIGYWKIWFCIVIAGLVTIILFGVTSRLKYYKVLKCICGMRYIEYKKLDDKMKKALQKCLNEDDIIYIKPSNTREKQIAEKDITDSSELNKIIDEIKNSINKIKKDKKVKNLNIKTLIELEKKMQNCENNQEYKELQKTFKKERKSKKNDLKYELELKKIELELFQKQLKGREKEEPPEPPQAE